MNIQKDICDKFKSGLDPIEEHIVEQDEIYTQGSRIKHYTTVSGSGIVPSSHCPRA